MPTHGNNREKIVRPSILAPLFAPITNLPGIGQRFARPLEKLCGPTIRDLAFHLPSGLIDRRKGEDINSVKSGEIATLLLSVEKHAKPRTTRQPYKVYCQTDTHAVTLTFFNVKGDYLLRALPIGEKRAVSGRLERYEGELTIVHPDYMAPASDLEKLRAIEPSYPLTAGISAKTLRKAIDFCLARLPDLPEWIDADFKARKGWRDWRESLLSAHHPMIEADLEKGTPIRSRLAYDELLGAQLALALMRVHSGNSAGQSTKGTGALIAKVRAALPYRLTPSQERALSDIAADMESPQPMARLLQGDVGSGKTIVAFLAMLTAVEAGGQAALLAPTEILARQHFKTLAPLAEKVGIEIAIVTGKDKAKARQAALRDLADGKIKLAVGTHALVQGDVLFQDLRLAIIDEQQRFGVAQRMALIGKGRGVDLLVTTATPIPRTLLLSAYGDIDVSRLSEKPAGRLPIDTRVMAADRLEEVVASLKRALDTGERIYWVCPLIEESEVSDAAAAEARARMLQAHFGNRVGLVHGRQKPAERDKIVADFATGAISLLVATTIIEVGIDVPEASVMVIEHAERFGLAQLHQLRGRIGRSNRRSFCLLLYQGPLSEIARARLDIMRQTNDGFVIAEEDLRLRGGGEILGHRQSGLPEFRFADLTRHGELLAAARDDAKLILARDPGLKTKRGEALRVLLYLLGKDQDVKTLRSG